MTYIEKILHRPVVIQPYTVSRKLPPVISNNYKLKMVIIDGKSCIFAEPSSDINLSVIRKQQKLLENLTGMICVLEFSKINGYTKERLIEDGIPFVIREKQIYLPFLGVALFDDDERVIKPCERISFLTQKLLLTSIYENWKDVSVSKAAERLFVAKTSVTRCYDEIEVLELPYIKTKSRSRLFSTDGCAREMWGQIRDVLRNPILQQFQFKNNINHEGVLSGMSALSVYSMLGDNPYPIYAVSKKEIGELLTENELLHSSADMPGCVIQELGYVIKFNKNQVIDPLSVALMITDSELSDPRVSKAVDEMLEAEVWLRTKN